MINIFVLTYSESKFTPEFLGESPHVGKFQIICNPFRPDQPVDAIKILEYQAQVTAIEFYRLLARAFSKGQLLRLANAAVSLVLLPFSRKIRGRLERSLKKSMVVRFGHEELWREARKSSLPALLIEDDAALAIDKEMFFDSLLEISSVLEVPYGVELSRSYNFKELGISQNQVSLVDDFRGLGRLYKLQPGASNTTCAALYSQLTVSALQSFSHESKFKLLPIDYFIDYFYLKKRRQIHNFHVVPGPFIQGSEFRSSP